jgi:hypothetical protein
MINEVEPKPGKKIFDKIVIIPRKRPPRTPKRLNKDCKY